MKSYLICFEKNLVLDVEKESKLMIKKFCDSILKPMFVGFVVSSLLIALVYGLSVFNRGIYIVIFMVFCWCIGFIFIEEIGGRAK